MLSFAEIIKKDESSLKIALAEELSALGYTPVDMDGFLFAKGSHPVMLCAHMDTVHHDNCTIICTSPDGKYWMSPQGIGGDDRCGIFMILQIIQKYNCSVLFLEEEESGCVGARKYADYIKKNPDDKTVQPDNLNYIIEIDRKSHNDAVFYECANKEFEKFITQEKYKFETSHGSCSDICYVAPALGVAAVNISSGYYNQHTIGEYINLQQVYDITDRLKGLIGEPTEKFEWVEEKPKYTNSYWNSGYSNRWGGYGSYYSGYKWYDYDDYDYSPTNEKERTPYEIAWDDFALDAGIDEDIYIDVRSLQLSYTYTCKTSDGESFEIDGIEEAFYDKDFNLYIESETLAPLIVKLDAKVEKVKYKGGAQSFNPVWLKSDAIPKYVMLEEYEDLFNMYYEENKDFYEDYIDMDDTIPADDDIDKKDEMEEDLMKLYN